MLLSLFMSLVLPNPKYPQTVQTSTCSAYDDIQSSKDDTSETGTF